MSRAAVPDEILEAVAVIYDSWPGLIELARWTKERRSGSVTFIVWDGGVQDLVTEEKNALGAKLAKTVAHLGTAICPVCRRDLVLEDAGNRFRCPPDDDGCDAVYTTWELTRRGSFRAKDEG